MRLTIDLSLAKRILSLAWPVVLAMTAQTVVNQVDTIVVGRLEGATSIDGVAGIGLSMPLFWAIGSLFSFVVGTQVITARRAGAHQPEEAGKTLTNSLAIGVTAGLIVSSVGAYFVPHIFGLLSPNPNVVRLGSQFLQIRMLGLVSMIVTFSFKGFFDGIGKTYVHMVASIVMNLLNIVLNLLLVFGWLGFPRMEVAGSALATLISTYVGLLVMIGWSLKGHYRKTYRFYRLSNLSWKSIWEIVRLSLPSGLATVFVMSGFEFFLWVTGHITPEPLVLSHLEVLPIVGPVLHGIEVLRPDLATSASWVLISFLMLVFMTSIAFGTATATLVSQSMGAKNFDLAERFGWESVKIGMYVMGALGIAVLIWPEAFLGIFIDKPDVIRVAVPATRLMGSVSSLTSAGLILVQALYGAGNTRFVMVAELILHSTCLIPLSFLLAVVLDFGILGAWTAAASYIVLLASVMAWKFHQGKWKSITI